MEAARGGGEIEMGGGTSFPCSGLNPRCKNHFHDLLPRAARCLCELQAIDRGLRAHTHTHCDVLTHTRTHSTCTHTPIRTSYDVLTLTHARDVHAGSMVALSPGWPHNRMRPAADVQAELMCECVWWRWWGREGLDADCTLRIDDLPSL